MSATPPFELAAAHRWFSGSCFNRAWDFIDLPARTPDEDEEMLAVALTSLWHWKQREDCTPRTLSVGYWQVSRVFSLLKQAENSRNFAEKCLSASLSESPFYIGYAYEALARAALVANERSVALDYVAKGRELASRVVEADERAALEKDLSNIESSARTH